MTIQDQINARDNPGPDARFCPHCGASLGLCVEWARCSCCDKLFTICIHCKKILSNIAVKRWGG